MSIKNNISGFTLIETVVYVAVFALVMAVVSGTIVYFYRTNDYTIQMSFAVESARRGVDTLVVEVREATYSDTGAYPLESAQSQSLIFYSDIDKDNNVEKIRYFLDGTDFKRGTIEPSGDPAIYDNNTEVVNVISDSVQNATSSVFSYYNYDGNEITGSFLLTDVAMVKVNLMVNIDPTRAPVNFTLRSNANLRNLKTNL